MEKVGIFYIWPFGMCILRPFDTYILWTLGNLVAIWYIFPRFGMLCQEKSGNPGAHFFAEKRSEPITNTRTCVVQKRSFYQPISYIVQKRLKHETKYLNRIF
jgi:hypothetical protein